MRLSAPGALLVYLACTRSVVWPEKIAFASGDQAIVKDVATLSWSKPKVAANGVDDVIVGAAVELSIGLNEEGLNVGIGAILFSVDGIVGGQYVGDMP